VVDDELVVRSLVGDVLRTSDYTVLEAPGGPEALRLAARHPGPLDLLVTDVLMPGMDGRALAAALRPARPGLRVLYMTGFADSGEVGNGAPVLEKPFSLTGLVEKVRGLLAA
jgi:CheY-like chemotaxis protein